MSDPASELRAAQTELGAIDAALNMDTHPGKDRETVARWYHHENVNLRLAAEGFKQAAEKAVKELADYKAMMHDKGP